MASRSKEELDALTTIDPEIDAIFKSGNFPIPKIDTSNVEAALSQLRGLQAHWPKPPTIPEVAESKHKYTASDGAELDLFVFRPANPPSTPLGLIIYFHGGGGVIGSAYSVAPLARELILAHSCVVVSPQYRLAPEHAFPTGPNDAWDAFVHVATHASSSLDFDPSAGLIVGGASQGAVLASLIALRAIAKEAQTQTPTLPRITGLLFSAGSFIATPETIPAEHTEAYRSRTDPRCLSAPILDADTKALFDTAYGADKSSPLYRAFNVQPLSSHAGVAPKALFQVCGMDILRDDSFIYAEILQALGVDTRVDVYEGAPHVFWSIFAKTKLAGRWREETKSGVTWLLGRDEQGAGKV